MLEAKIPSSEENSNSQRGSHKHWRKWLKSYKTYCKGLTEIYLWRIILPENAWNKIFLFSMHVVFIV